MKKVYAIVMMLGMVFSMAACNTVDGVGRDVERVGEEVSDAAN